MLQVPSPCVCVCAFVYIRVNACNICVLGVTHVCEIRRFHNWKSVGRSVVLKRGLEYKYRYICPNIQTMFFMLFVFGLENEPFFSCQCACASGYTHTCVWMYLCMYMRTFVEHIPGHIQVPLIGRWRRTKLLRCCVYLSTACACR